jgi:hypothetical protein
MTMYARREDALAAAIGVAPDLGDVLDQLGRFPISGQTGLVVDRATIRRGIDAYERGEISASILQEWAEALHTAEDADLAQPDRERVARALFILSTPELFGQVEDNVRELRTQLDHTP